MVSPLTSVYRARREIYLCTYLIACYFRTTCPPDAIVLLFLSSATGFFRFTNPRLIGQVTRFSGRARTLRYTSLVLAQSLAQQWSAGEALRPRGDPLVERETFQGFLKFLSVQRLGQVRGSASSDTFAAAVRGGIGGDHDDFGRGRALLDF